jgi:hypothetical protein
MTKETERGITIAGEQMKKACQEAGEAMSELSKSLKELKNNKTFENKSKFHK